jgi:hypothetical protein
MMPIFEVIGGTKKWRDAVKAKVAEEMGPIGDKIYPKNKPIKKKKRKSKTK